MELSVSGVLGEALGLYQRFFWRFVAVAAVVFVVLNLLTAIVISSSSTVGAAIWGLVSLLAAIVGSFWVQGALVEAVQDVRDGRVDMTIGELYERTRPFLPALIAAGLLAGIGISIGLVLLIVPGLVLLTRWSVLVPVIVLEKRRAGEAFGRSTELVRGSGWTVFGIVIVTLIASAIARNILFALFTFLPDFLQAWVGGLIADSLTVPLVALAWTVMYYRLAQRGEPAAASV